MDITFCMLKVGTHQELMTKNGLYADLVRRQMQDQD